MDESPASRQLDSPFALLSMSANWRPVRSVAMSRRAKPMCTGCRSFRIQTAGGGARACGWIAARPGLPGGPSLKTRRVVDLTVHWLGGTLR